MPIEVRTERELPAGFDRLLEESRAEGYAFLKRLDGESRLEPPPYCAADAILLSAWLEGRLVGICGVYRDHHLNDPQVGRLRHVFVTREVRRSGVGRRLVEASLEHARRHFRLLRLRTETPEAARFYSAVGFTPCEPLRTATPTATHEMPIPGAASLTTASSSTAR